MSAFWPLLRYPSFFMLLFPADASLTLFQGEGFLSEITAPVAFLVTLAVAAVVSAIGWRRVTVVLSHPPVVCLLGIQSSFAALLGLLVTRNVFGHVVVFVSVPLACVGFLALLLAWASYLSRSFDARTVASLCVSLLLSFAFFSRDGLIGNVGGGWVAAVLMPAFSAAAWCCVASRSVRACEDIVHGE